MLDEGYIKFQPVWTPAEPLNWNILNELDHWRTVLYQHQLIGAYDNGIGFGNISQRWNAGHQFIISGSATGNIAKLNSQHYSLVERVEVDQNTLYCSGPILASSESMSHAVIYQECPWVNAVIHVHHLEYWKTLLHQIPTTPEQATYGTPDMAYAIIDLLQNDDLIKKKLFVMAGHEEGIFAFGESLETAASSLLNLPTY
ncbi:MAG: hypothetical protein DHS20C18_13790 [Saprospiraceae bacterium]|nr:MAG: hypothetical protein DHS20C18_13790 [Saprospiraceae bacterium]